MLIVVANWARAGEMETEAQTVHATNPQKVEMVSLRTSTSLRLKTSFEEGVHCSEFLLDVKKKR